MIIKILGAIDMLIAALLFLFTKFSFIPEKMIIIAAVYLFAKGLIFLISKDIASILDVSSAILMYFAATASIPEIIPLLVVLFLLQKGIFSMLN